MKRYKYEPRRSSGVSPVDVLQIVFIVLKLVGAIDWSWWLVFAPWIVQIILLIVIVICAIIYDKIKY